LAYSQLYLTLPEVRREDGTYLPTWHVMSYNPVVLLTDTLSL